ncbi:winged helix-turn-helix domain-containing protein [Niabella aquatica]
MDHFKIVFNKWDKKADQIAWAIATEIEKGNISAGEQLPSINKFSISYKVARDTVEKAYGILKNQGLIRSIAGKGYFAVKNKLTARKAIVIVSSMNEHEEILCHALIQYLKTETNIDVRMYYYSNHLQDLLENNRLIYRHSAS